MNGKLINTEFQQSELIQKNLDNILQEIKNLEPVLEEQNDKINLIELCVKDLQERIDEDEMDKNPIFLNKKSSKLNLLTKLGIFVAVLLIGLEGLNFYYLNNEERCFIYKQNASKISKD